MSSSRSSKVHNPHQCNYIIYRKVKTKPNPKTGHYKEVPAMVTWKLNTHDYD